MIVKVTFRPLKRGRYRAIIDGVLSGVITKNPKKTRYQIIKTADAPRIQKLREEEKARKKAEFNDYPWMRKFNYSW